MSISNADARGGETTIRRPNPLDTDTWASYRGMELEGALAIVQRIRAYWRATLPGSWFSVVPEDDQGLYDTLYHDLFFILSQRPDLEALVTELRELVPEQPIDSDLALAISDDQIQGSIFDGFNRASSRIRRLLVSEGKPFLDSPVEELFSFFDLEIAYMASNAKAQSDVVARRLGLVTDPPATPSPVTDKPRAKAGRKPVDLSYKDAQDAYWNVLEGLEEAGERRPPNYADVCDQLGKIGVAVRKSTFGKHVGKWKRAGKRWPPPHPDSAT